MTLGLSLIRDRAFCLAWCALLDLNQRKHPIALNAL